MPTFYYCNCYKKHKYLLEKVREIPFYCVECNEKSKEVKVEDTNWKKYGVVIPILIGLLLWGFFYFIVFIYGNGKGYEWKIFLGTLWLSLMITIGFIAFCYWMNGIRVFSNAVQIIEQKQKGVE